MHASIDTKTREELCKIANRQGRQKVIVHFLLLRASSRSGWPFAASSLLSSRFLLVCGHHTTSPPSRMYEMTPVIAIAACDDGQ